MISNKKRIVHISSFLDPAGIEILRAEPDIEVLSIDQTQSDEGNDALFAGALGFQIGSRHAIKARWHPDDPFFVKFPQMLALCSAQAGYEAINVEAATKAGVIVCNQAGTNKEAVAEHTLGFMLALSKNMMLTDRIVHRQAGIEKNIYKGHDLLGHTVGLIGFGHVGRRVAELCRGLFQMTILAYDPYVDAATMTRHGALKTELNDLLPEADFVSIHCGWTAETKGMIGRAQFARMKKGAYFVTTARGGIHDEAALVEALASGHLAGAGVDVFLVEPPGPDHPLMKFDNVIANPHMAGVTFELRSNLARECARQWIEIMQGKVPPRLVNPEVWPRYAARFEGIMGFRPEGLAV